MDSPPSTSAPHPLVLAVYGCWLLAVVVFLLGRYTAVPSFDLAYYAVVVGTGIFAVLGAAQLFRDWLPRLRAVVGGDGRGTGSDEE